MSFRVLDIDSTGNRLYKLIDNKHSSDENSLSNSATETVTKMITEKVSLMKNCDPPGTITEASEKDSAKWPNGTKQSHGSRSLQAAAHKASGSTFNGSKSTNRFSKLAIEAKHTNKKY